MEVCTLENRHLAKHPHSHFFDKQTLRWWGERKSEMRVLRDKIVINDYSGVPHTCYILSSRQRNAFFDKPTRVHHYFDCETYDVIDGKHF